MSSVGQLVVMPGAGLGTEEEGCKGLSIYYVSSYNKAGSVGMLTNAYLREQGFIKKLMSYENPHYMRKSI